MNTMTNLSGEKRRALASAAYRQAVKAADTTWAAGCTDWRSAQQAEVAHRAAMQAARAEAARSVGQGMNASDLSRWAFMSACAAVKYGDNGKQLAARVNAARDCADALIAMLARGAA